MNKFSIKLISLILSIAIILVTVPLTVFATTRDKSEDANTIITDEAMLGNIMSDIYELTDRRDEYTKHFRLEDGSVIAAQYDDPVHYLDQNNNWQDIDNTLSDVGSEYSTSNAKIKFAKKITGNESLFTLHDGNAKITMSLDGAIKKTAGTVINHSDDNEMTKLQKMMSLEKISATIVYADILDGVDLEYIVKSDYVKENIIVKERQNSYAYTFTLKLNNLDAVLNSDGSISIIEPGTDNIVYAIPAPVVYDDNYNYAPSEAAYYLLDKIGTNKYSLTVQVDSEWMNAEERVYPVVVDPTVYKGGRKLGQMRDTYVSSANPGTNYGGQKVLRAGYDPTYGHTRSYIYLKPLPTLPKGSYITSAEINLQISSISELNDITLAAYTIDMGTTSLWSETKTTWSTHPAQFSQLLDYVNIEYMTETYDWSWDITEAAKKWYSGALPNHGICIGLLEESLTSTNCVVFHASESDSSAAGSYLPFYSFTYRDAKGLEDYYSYSSGSAGLVGTYSINNATGNMVLVTPLLSTTDSLMPLTLSLVYNSTLAGIPYQYSDSVMTAYTNGYTPYGFKLNIQETIIKKSYINSSHATAYHYIWADADGTEHYFLPIEGENNKYQDDDGLQLILDTSSSTQLTITDNSKTVRKFAKMSSSPSGTAEAWYLSSIADKNNNAVSFAFDGAYRPIAVNLVPNGGSPINFITLSYNTNGLLYLVWNQTSKDGVVIKYRDQFGNTAEGYEYVLGQISYLHGNDSTTLQNWNDYYNSSSNQNNITLDALANYTIMYNSLSRAYDSLSNSTFVFGYVGNGTNVSLKQVQKSSNNTTGQKISFEYFNGYTEIRTSGSDDVHGNDDDIITVCTFDGELRLKSKYSTDLSRSKIYGAVSGEYETQQNVKNNVKHSTTVGGSATNYLVNGGFETTTTSGVMSGWSRTSNVYLRTTGGGGTRDWGYIEVRAQAGVTDSVSQHVLLPEGEYTLSMSLDSGSATNAKVYMKAVSVSNGTHTFIKECPVSKDYASSTIEVSMPISALNVTNGGEIFKISIEVTGDSNLSGYCSVQFDNVMLAKCVGSAPFTRVECGDFESFSVNSNGSFITSVSDFWETSGSSVDLEASAYPFGNVAYIESNNGNTEYVKQRIYTAGYSILDDYDSGAAYYESDKTYVVAGFAKICNSLPKDVARIRVDVNYYQGSGNDLYVQPYYFDFQKGSDAWQFVSGTFDTTAGDVVHSIDIYCEFSSIGLGYAMFDNISVFQSGIDEFEECLYYGDADGAKNGLLYYKKSGSYYEVYDYDNQKNLTRVANNMGEIHDYTYDDKGNVVREVYYKFQNNNGLPIYPVFNNDPDSFITKTPQTITEYHYNNSYGLLSEIDAYEAQYNSNGDVVAKTNAKHVITSYSYNLGGESRIFGSLATETSSRGVVTRYYYDATNGHLLATVNQSKGTGICYTYDALGNITLVTPATYVSSTQQYSSVNNAEKVEYTYNSNNRLNTITTESTTYYFNYDAFGNATDISAGDRELASYTYNPNNGKLATMTYGNGTTVRYVYDELDNIKELWYNVGGTETKAYEYSYTWLGQIARFDDLINGTSVIYTYDGSGRLTNVTEYDTADMKNNFGAYTFYNEKSQVSSVFYSSDYIYPAGVESTSWWYSYSYMPDGSLDYVSVNSDITMGEIDYTYDTFNRITSKKYSYTYDYETDYVNNVTYSYAPGVYDNTTALVSGYTSTVNGTSTNYSYIYDSNGNIEKIYIGTTAVYRYKYDDLGQLVREDNVELNRTYVYTYDNAGNILTKKTYALTSEGVTPTNPQSTVNYGYNDASWGDLLTSYGGQNITYDAIGNPLSYYNGSRYTFTWKQGRRLATAVKGSNTLSFEYNDEGIRVSKTVNGVKHSYHLNGSQIAYEEWGNNLLIYLYDADGSPIGMLHRTTSDASYDFDAYWFEKILQGDIVAVYSSSGTKLVTYKYDAWGNITTTYYNGGASTVAQYNPFRYRGYYYDTETGLYYVSSRYYDPEIGRWINADNQFSTGSDLTGMNLFAYCGNNPVNRIDLTGEAWWHWALGAAVVAACAVATVVTCGGFAAAATAVCMVGSGVAAATTASTVAAGAFIGSATVYGMAVLSAASTSSSVQEFNDQGNWGTVAATAFGGLTGGYDGYTMSKAQTPTSTPTGRGTQNPKVKAAVQKGQAMHKQMDYGPGVLKEQTIAPGCRVDGIDFNNRIIYELKPNNPQAIARGMNQLNRYTSAASQQFGGTWTGVLKLYD